LVTVVSHYGSILASLATVFLSVLMTVGPFHWPKVSNSEITPLSWHEQLFCFRDLWQWY